MTLYNVADDLNLTLGKFRQQFGIVNRWHRHGLDQVDFPLALRQIFGNGGLNQAGLSLDWLMPPAGVASQQLTFQVTDGSNIVYLVITPVTGPVFLHTTRTTGICQKTPIWNVVLAG